MIIFRLADSLIRRGTVNWLYLSSVTLLSILAERAEGANEGNVGGMSLGSGILWGASVLGGVFAVIRIADYWFNMKYLASKAEDKGGPGLECSSRVYRQLTDLAQEHYKTREDIQRLASIQAMLQKDMQKLASLFDRYVAAADERHHSYVETIRRIESKIA